MTSSLFVPIGKIATAHGLKGEFKILYYGNDTKDFLVHENYFDKNQEILPLKIRTAQNKYLIASLPNITTREESEALSKKEIYAFLTEDDTNYYYAELIGMQITDETGNILGEIKEISNYGAGDIIEISFQNGKSEMYIFNKDNFPNIDRKNRKVTFVLPEQA